MMIVLQHCLNALEIAVLYSLVACGFYLASISTRHFSFAAALGFVIAPYTALVSKSGPSRFALALLGLCLCGALGLAYQRLSAHLSKKGAREGQLLIVSLATMGVGENIITLLFGSSSQTIASPIGSAGAAWPLPQASGQQLTVLVLGWGSLALILFQWRRTLIGKTLQGLVESRLNLSLRGMPVRGIEAAAAAFGFILVGAAGTFWAMDGRIKPAMCTEVGVIGAVTFIVGALVKSGPGGLAIAAAALALVRLFLSLTLEGDWSMTAMLLVLGCALLLKRRTILRVESAL
jgi:branched-subunit amino acid ABC-type transport system permease component